MPIHAILNGKTNMKQLQRELTWRCKKLLGAQHCALYTVRQVAVHSTELELELVAHTLRDPFVGLASEDEDEPAAAGASSLSIDSALPVPPLKFELSGLVGEVADTGTVRILKNPSTDELYDAKVDDPL